MRLGAGCRCRGGGWRGAESGLIELGTAFLSHKSLSGGDGCQLAQLVAERAACKFLGDDGQAVLIGLALAFG